MTVVNWNRPLNIELCDLYICPSQSSDCEICRMALMRFHYTQHFHLHRQTVNIRQAGNPPTQTYTRTHTHSNTQTHWAGGRCTKGDAEAFSCGRFSTLQFGFYHCDGPLLPSLPFPLQILSQSHQEQQTKSNIYPTSLRSTAICFFNPFLKFL